MKRNKKLEGISLIVLVISIIIMIVLATAMVLTITNSGILEQSNVAVNDSNVSNAKEELQTKYVEWLSNGYTSNTKMSKEEAQSLIDVSKYNLHGKYAVRVTQTGVPYLKGKVESRVNWEISEYSHANMTYAGLNIGYGYNNPIIPKGFKPLETPDASWEYLDFNDGLVIQDQNGNQFVWVPVRDMTKFKQYSYQLLDGSEELPYVTTVNGEEVENCGEYQSTFTAIKNSVAIYGGYYVGRYEAGDSNIALTGETVSGRQGVVNQSGILGVRQDLLPYNNVQHGKAIRLSTNMYDSSYGVVSTLISSTQWDYMLEWMNDFKSDKSILLNSTSWGNMLDNTSTLRAGIYMCVCAFNNQGYTFTYQENAYFKDGQGERIITTTGASDEYKKKNIYDVAGNLLEFTMENNGDNVAFRSGRFASNGATYPAALRAHETNISVAYTLTFRVALYIK